MLKDKKILIELEDSIVSYLWVSEDEYLQFVQQDETLLQNVKIATRKSLVTGLLLVNFPLSASAGNLKVLKDKQAANPTEIVCMDKRTSVGKTFDYRPESVKMKQRRKKLLPKVKGVSLMTIVLV